MKHVYFSTKEVESDIFGNKVPDYTGYTEQEEIEAEVARLSKVIGIEEPGLSTPVAWQIPGYQKIYEEECQRDPIEEFRYESEKKLFKESGQPHYEEMFGDFSPYYRGQIVDEKDCQQSDAEKMEALRQKMLEEQAEKDDPHGLKAMKEQLAGLDSVDTTNYYDVNKGNKNRMMETKNTY